MGETTVKSVMTNDLINLLEAFYDHWVNVELIKDVDKANLYDFLEWLKNNRLAEIKQKNSFEAIAESLDNIVYPMIGPRCKTKDKHDFPDLKGDERCLVCVTYEEIDRATQAINKLIT